MWYVVRWNKGLTNQVNTCPFLLSPSEAKLKWYACVREISFKQTDRKLHLYTWIHRALYKISPFYHSPLLSRPQTVLTVLFSPLLSHLPSHISLSWFSGGSLKALTWVTTQFNPSFLLPTSAILFIYICTSFPDHNNFLCLLSTPSFDQTRCSSS